MRRPVKIALAFFLFVLISTVAWQMLRPQEPEPVYQGKPLSHWLREYATGLNAHDEVRVQRHNRAEVAVRRIGTNAIPTLLKMLGAKDSGIVSQLVNFWGRHRYRLPSWLRYPGWYRNQAASLNTEGELGFVILGADAQQAVLALIDIYHQNISPHSQAATSRAINAIGPAAQRLAIPSFLSAAAGSNVFPHEVAIWALSEVDAEQQQVVPALINALSDTNFVIRLVAARGLGRFGTIAQPAVPALVRLLNDSNLGVCLAATNALKAVDSEAAEKAGVK